MSFGTHSGQPFNPTDGTSNQISTSELGRMIFGNQLPGTSQTPQQQVDQSQQSGGILKMRQPSGPMPMPMPMPGQQPGGKSGGGMVPGGKYMTGGPAVMPDQNMYGGGGAQDQNIFNGQ